MRLSDRVYVITGGGSGIGAATVRRLADEGARTVSLDLTAERAVASAPTLGIACDVTDEAAVTGALDQVLERFGRLDGAVLNAGIAHEVPLTETTLAD